MLKTCPVDSIVREIPLPPNVDALARALRGAPELVVLRSDPRGALREDDAAASFLACDAVETSDAWVPGDGGEARPARGWSGRRAGPRWVGLIPYEATRAIERSGWTRSPDDRKRVHFERPAWFRYDAVLRVDHPSGRVAIEADDDRAADRLARRLRRGDPARAPIRRPPPPLDRARRAPRGAGPRGPPAHRRRRHLPGEHRARDRPRARRRRPARRLLRPLWRVSRPLRLLRRLRRSVRLRSEPRARARGDGRAGPHRADQGDSPARTRRPRRPRARSRARRRREGAGGADDGDRSPPQRPRAGGGHGERPRPRRAARRRRSHCLEPRVRGGGAAGAGDDARGDRPRGPPVRERDRRAEGPRDGNHRRARAVAARRVHRGVRIRLARERPRPRDGDPHARGHRPGAGGGTGPGGGSWPTATPSARWKRPSGRRRSSRRSSRAARPQREQGGPHWATPAPQSCPQRRAFDSAGSER